jgi:DUF4097 and DUF4098 domain-containing protein YvlB
MRIAVAAGLLLSSLAASSCVVSVDSQAQVIREEKRFAVSGTPELQLTTFDGAIEIRSWDNPEVLVAIEKRGPTEEAVSQLVVTAGQDGNRIRVEVKRPPSETLGGFRFNSSPSAKLVVSAPRSSNIVARSGDGSIRIERMSGRMSLHTEDGSIRATDVEGDLTFTSGDGSIHVAGARGRIDVETGDGSVDVAGPLSAVKLHTGDGSIVYRAEDLAAMTDNWDITTGDGSVSLYLPSGFSAELDAHTGDGSIRNELDVNRPVLQAESEPDAAAAQPRDPDDKRTIRGRLGAGGKRLRIRTGDGSIHLRAS